MQDLLNKTKEEWMNYKNTVGKYIFPEDDYVASFWLSKLKAYGEEVRVSAQQEVVERAIKEIEKLEPKVKPNGNGIDSDDYYVLGYEQAKMTILLALKSQLEQ